MNRHRLDACYFDANYIYQTTEFYYAVDYWVEKAKCSRFNYCTTERRRKMRKEIICEGSPGIEAGCDKDELRCNGMCSTDSDCGSDRHCVASTEKDFPGPGTCQDGAPASNSASSLTTEEMNALVREQNLAALVDTQEAVETICASQCASPSPSPSF